MNMTISRGPDTPTRELNADSLGEVVRTLTPRVRSMVRRYRLGSCQTEDLVQSVWLLLIEHLDSIEDPRRIVGWLRTTAAREAIRVAGRAAREVPSDLVTEVAAAAQVGDEVARSDRDHTLWQVIELLPARDRLLLELIAHRPELGYRELAQRLGISPNSVGQVRTRCLRRLRRKLAAVGITDARL